MQTPTPNPLLLFVHEAVDVHVERPNFTAIQLALAVVSPGYTVEQQQEANLALLFDMEQRYKLDSLADIVEKYRVRK